MLILVPLGAINLLHVPNWELEVQASKSQVMPRLRPRNATAPRDYLHELSSPATATDIKFLRLTSASCGSINMSTHASVLSSSSTAPDDTELQNAAPHCIVARSSDALR